MCKKCLKFIDEYHQKEKKAFDVYYTSSCTPTDDLELQKERYRNKKQRAFLTCAKKINKLHKKE
jgi:hypothetical protein